jgi:outer membrane protein TolC
MPTPYEPGNPDLKHLEHRSRTTDTARFAVLLCTGLSLSLVSVGYALAASDTLPESPGAPALASVAPADASASVPAAAHTLVEVAKGDSMRALIGRVSGEDSPVAASDEPPAAPPEPEQAPISEAELDKARHRRDVVMPALWHARDELPRVLANTPDAARSATDVPASPDVSQRISLGLEDAVAFALRENLDLEVARLTRDAVESTIAQGEATFQPTLGLSAIANRDSPFVDRDRTTEEDSRTVAAFVREQLPTGGSVTVSSSVLRDDELDNPYEGDVAVSVVQPLLRGGGFVVATRPISDAKFNVAIEEARLRQEVLRIVLETKRAYYDTVLALLVIDATNEAITRDHQLLEASGSLFNRRLVTKRDVYSAEILLADDKATLAEAEEAFDLRRNDLLDIVGLPISAIVDLTDGQLPFAPITIEEDRWIATAVRSRPEVLELDERMRKSRLNVSVAKNTVFPQLDVVGAYGRGESADSAAQAFDLNGDRWTAGLVFSFPIGNVGPRAALTQAEIEHSRLRFQLADTERFVELEVRAAALKLKRTELTARAFEMKKRSSEGKLEVSKARFTLGVDTNLDITDSQTDLLDADIELLRAIRDYNIGLAELERSVGGPI